jgi:hypothetical protein
MCNTQGDAVEIVIINREGVRRELMDLKRDWTGKPNWLNSGQAIDAGLNVACFWLSFELKCAHQVRSVLVWDAYQAHCA